MSDNIVMEAKNIKKRYKIYRTPWHIMAEWATLGKRSYHKDYWALKGVSFKVKKSEFVGIIGPNGAGKSTLLSIVTDVIRPTEGSYSTTGRVLSILELSGGTDKDLTGRANVIRSGQMLGFPDGYVKERMEIIKDFSELGDFFDQPLRMYSSGMKARLSFSMFAFMDTDVLILDEVLAVGDIFFKQKCFSRLAELIEKKTSILLVTHSMGIVQRYCNRVIVLDSGNKLYDGEPGEAIKLYMQLRGEKKADAIKKLDMGQELDEELGTILTPRKKEKTVARPVAWPPEEVFTFTSFPELVGKGRVSFIRFAVLNDQGESTLSFKQGDRMHFYCEFSLKREIEMPVVNIEIRDKLNLLVHSKSSIQNHAEMPVTVSKGEVVHYHQSITLNLAPKNYVINIDCGEVPASGLTKTNRMKQTGVRAMSNNLWRLDRAFAITIMHEYGENMELPHGGLCDLPGTSKAEAIPESV